MSSTTSERGLLEVPLRAPLSAQYKNTFAYPTIKDRCPIILCKVIDHLYRERISIGKVYGAAAQDGLKRIVEELSRLRYEMQTNKEIVAISDARENAVVWNRYLEEERLRGEACRWFTASWMWAECYMYRRIWESLYTIPELRHFDFFRQQKDEGLKDSMQSMNQLGGWLVERLTDLNHAQNYQIWRNLIQVSLWGNKCDLSISAGSRQSATGDAIQRLTDLTENILVNETEAAWTTLQKEAGGTVDIVMDNAGYELFTDLCLADFLISSKIATKVRFRIKDQPWFVSDITMEDFHRTLDRLSRESNDNYGHIAALGCRWRGYLSAGQWSVSADTFWTYPHVFCRMTEVEPQLYSSLAEARLCIFKGDLNYRKLVGDLNWEATAPFKTALQGFLPSNLLALRTLKADVVAGLATGQAEQITSRDPDWMVNGNWGVIQFASL